MRTKEEYRAKAKECLQMASGITNGVGASLLRILAGDYLNLAEKGDDLDARQQSKEPERDA